MFAPNIAWRNVDLKAELEARVHLPVVIENDANAAAWGEFRFGAGAGRRRPAAGHRRHRRRRGTGPRRRALPRRLRRRRARSATCASCPTGILCGCGNHGCLEQYASGSAMVREARVAARGGSLLARGLLDRAGGDLERITGPLITEAAQEGDPFAAEQLAHTGFWLGEGIASLTAVLDPAVVVIGGGVSEAGDLLLGPVALGVQRPADRPRPPPGAGDPQGRARQPGRAHRRRRPGPAVGPAMGLFVGVDVGGTKVLAAVVSEAGEVLRTARRSTPGRRVEAALVEDALTEAVHEVAAGEPVAGVGHRRGRASSTPAASGCMFAPHLPWRDEDVRARLAERWGTVGGARQRRQLRGPRRVPLRRGPRRVRRRRAHAGHRDRRRGGPRRRRCTGGATAWPGSSGTCRWCPAAGPASAAAAAAGSSTAAATRWCASPATGSAASRPCSRSSAAATRSGSTGPMVTAAAEDGDLVARQAFASVGDWLGVGVANLVAALDPERVVVGGGVSAAGDRLLEPARDRATPLAGGRGAPRGAAAACARSSGPQAGVVGAADLARSLAGC